MRTIKDGIIGLAIGDAIGVPVEFKSREVLEQDPVTDMRAYGTHHQPAGTWSDDSSLTFCTAEALLEEFSLKQIAENFIHWCDGLLWTPHGLVFDIGIQTSGAIEQLRTILDSKDYEKLKYLKYEADERTNGNGSLMRILPLYYYLKEGSISENFDTIWEVSALTHGHIRSAISCLIYLIMVDELMNGRSKQQAYRLMRNRIKAFFQKREIVASERQLFDRIIESDLSSVKKNEIRSTAYVVHSLEASLWCFLKSRDYKDCILAAVNLGEDTDTIAAIAGGLAGIYYGAGSFPKSWYANLARIPEIEVLCDRLEERWK